MKKIFKRIFNRKSSQRLRLTALNGHEVHVVEGDNPKSLALLAKTYTEVYEEAFPIDEERESLDTWIKNLQDKTNSNKLTISILGDNLDKPNPTIKAMTVGFYFDGHNVGELSYIATAPQYRGKGLGRSLNEANNIALMNSAKNNGKEIQGIFFEVNDPAKIKPEDDVMDPLKRIEMYARWGAIILPIDYVQPPLKAETDKCDKLKLMAYRHPETGAYPTKKAIKGYLTAVYTEAARMTGCPPEQNPDYTVSVTQLDKLDLDKYYKTLVNKPKPPKPPSRAA